MMARSLRFPSRVLRLLVPAAILVQFGGCLGGDPRFLLATTVTEAVTSAVFASLVNSLLAAATGQG